MNSRTPQGVTWSDMAKVAQAAGALVEAVACSRTAVATAPVRPWPTQAPRQAPATSPVPPLVPPSQPYPVPATEPFPEPPLEPPSEAPVPAPASTLPQEPTDASHLGTVSPSYTEPQVKDAPVAAVQGAEPVSSPALDEYDATNERTRPLRSTRVPSSRLGRLLHYGGLGAGLAWGSASEYMRRATSGSQAPRSTSPAFLSPGNVDRLVDKLSMMRGAALKLGQFLSIQDNHVLPPQVEEVLLRVQDTAHYMPAWQLERVMREDLGEDWRTQFSSFDERPLAAASIGQVHTAVLADPFPSQPHLAGQRVAVKVQFPGVSESIASDLGNIKWLLVASALLPKGLFLENSVRVLQQELQEECDYTREADMGRRFRAHVRAMAPSDERALTFEVPEVVDALSTRRVLTTEFMRGRPLTQIMSQDQTTRDAIAYAIMELSLRELFDWHLMQTDPNWTNFLYHEGRRAIQLIDFGATRAYTPEFIAMWLGLLRAAVSGDRSLCERWSVDIGYLTGQESEVRARD